MDTIMLTPEEAFRVLGIGRTYGYRLIKNGTLPSVKLGRLRRVPRHALEAWVERTIEESGPTDSDRNF
jgi:excisionase family DNA binding protein